MSSNNDHSLASYQCASERLHQAGLRVTQQRAQLLSLLVESHQIGEHLDAEALHARSLDAGMDVSLATVYRTLAVFKEVGLVAQHHFCHAGGRDLYEVATQPTHHHFTCLGCGEVIEFDAPDFHTLCDGIAQTLGVELTDASLYLNGLCPQCREEE